MRTAFVTGATGFIGSHVALQLLEEGWSVRALCRKISSAPVELEGTEWITGDLRQYEELRKAMEGSEAVFHVAADYRLWAPKPQELYDSNVQGTINVLKAALETGASRVVYTSSVGALGLNPDGTPANETTAVSFADMIGDYKKSKFLAEREAEKFLARGLPLVMVHPSTPVGPRDRKPTPTGKIIVDFLNRKMPAYVDTGLNIVHVKDVARGHLLALSKGRIGEKYILGNRNMTLDELFRLMESISGIPGPRFKLPHAPILWLAHICKGISNLTGKEPLIPLDGVKMARKYMYFDASKAVRELSLPQTPVEDALADAINWFTENGYVR